MILLEPGCQQLTFLAGGLLSTATSPHPSVARGSTMTQHSCSYESFHRHGWGLYGKENRCFPDAVQRLVRGIQTPQGRTCRLAARRFRSGGRLRAAGAFESCSPPTGPTYGDSPARPRSTQVSRCRTDLAGRTATRRAATSGPRRAAQSRNAMRRALCRAAQCRAMSRRAAPHRATPRRAAPCSALLCYDTLLERTGMQERKRSSDQRSQVPSSQGLFRYG